jgi:ubiquinone/menaquinone biosynthesis C-methylase UbiE
MGPDVMKMRRDLVARHMDVAGKPVLEIGAFDRPQYSRAEVDLRVLDYLPTEDLVALARRSEGRNPAKVVHVDYVAASSLVSCYVDRRFDLIVCNHVLEHIPNLLEWLWDVRKILNSGGRLSFSLPDRAYTYDFLRHETTIVELLRAYVESPGKPDFWQILDGFYYYRPITGVEGWHPEVLAKRLHSPQYSLLSAVAAAEAASALPYHDTHCTVFTRNSFVALMGELGASGLIGFRLDEVTEVERLTLEFFGLMSVDPSRESMPPEIDDLRATRTRKRAKAEEPQRSPSSAMLLRPPQISAAIEAKQEARGLDAVPTPRLPLATFDPGSVPTGVETAREIALDVPVTHGNFEEKAYLCANPDVMAAVEQGIVASGRVHFESAGWNEGRRIRVLDGVVAMRRRKMERIRPLVRRDLPFTEDRASGGKLDFLVPSLRNEARITATDNVSSWPYDAAITALLAEVPDGNILDCGAGKRPVYYENVVNYEIVDYDTTDVIGVGEHLPFHDNSFDIVLSLVTLEHVQDPFRCADEISRVLKPGGKLYCTMPFLAPLHGYPNHYFNATHQGLRRLFEHRLAVERMSVPFGFHPIFALQWITSSWADGLTGTTKHEFLDMRVRDLLADPVSQAGKPFVAELGEAKCFELACGNVIEARKRP